MILKDIWDKLRPGEPFIISKKSYWGFTGAGAWYCTKIDSDSFIAHENERGTYFTASYNLEHNELLYRLLIDDYYSSFEEFNTKLIKELR